MDKKKEKVYLAGPFFNDKERRIIEEIAKILRTKYEVFVPMEHFVEDGKNMPNHQWGNKVYQMDKKAIDDVDFLIAIDHGFTSDAGTAWEVGYAAGQSKRVLVVSVSEELIPVHSVMMINGCTRFFKGFGDCWKYLCGENVPEYFELGVEAK